MEELVINWQCRQIISFWSRGQAMHFFISTSVPSGSGVPSEQSTSTRKKEWESGEPEKGRGWRTMLGKDWSKQDERGMNVSPQYSFVIRKARAQGFPPFDLREHGSDKREVKTHPLSKKQRPSNGMQCLISYIPLYPGCFLIRMLSNHSGSSHYWNVGPWRLACSNNGSF